MKYADFEEFNHRVNTLITHYLPQNNPTATYTPTEVDNMRALRLLVHAEVEEFLESLCKLLAKELKQQCRLVSNQNIVSRIHKNWGEACADKSIQEASSNHGVKDANIRKLFQPLGFNDEDFDEIDPLFLDKMKQFGQRRGDVAHKSALRTTYAITAQGERQLLEEVIMHVEGFCKEVHRRRLIGFF